MALNKNVLKQAIKAIQDSNPATIEDASKKWATALFGYGSLAVAGSVLPTLNVASLTASFLSSMKSTTWMDDLGRNLLSWWQAALWAGPGFTGVTVPPSPLNSHNLGERIKDGVDDVSEFLSTEIDKWTKTITVTVTNTSSGATSTAPVS